MKSGRRTDSESSRRDSRDISHNVNRFRKRPSMLSEFHGSKHYNHRDLDRDGSEASHFRGLHHRYSNDTSSSSTGGGGGSGSADRYGSPGFYKSKTDPRGRHPYHHHNYRSSSSSHHFHSSNTHYHSSTFDEEAPAKRPRLSVDVNRRAPSQFDGPNSADSAASNSNFTGDSVTLTGTHQSPEPVSPLHGSGGGGLSAYLEDIDSDDDDSLLRDEEDDKLTSSGAVKSFPHANSTDLATSNHQGLPVAPPIIPIQADKPSPLSTSPKLTLPSKEELLQMMEKVDRDIAATETQIATLQKKQAELEESAKLQRISTVSPALSTPSPYHTSPLTPSLDGHESQLSDQSEEDGKDEEDELGGVSVLSPSNGGQKRSLCDVIYAENKAKAKTAQMALAPLHFPPLPALGVIPLYHQPSEIPDYYQTILSHRKFRPKLVDFIKKRKLERHQSELKLCERYDSLTVEWEKRVNRMENSNKKRARDAKNRELFEKCFPELKARREQQERFTRVDQRGYGVVRSDADLSELAIELLEQEEASVRYHKTHASIPAMVVDKREHGVRFYSSNGLIADPMAVYRETKLINVWSEEEKRIFREKYLQYPKNFEMISTFLPNKSAAECVKYYYLSKKNENFKQIVRKANFKRKKPYFKQTDLQPSSSSLLSTTTPSLSLPPSFTEEKIKQESLTDNETVSRAEPAYGEWSEEEIESLKEGLRKYGRAWGKIYREVGGRKTATQCKQFYDELCHDEKLKLFQALTEHSKMKNAEKLRRKAESRKAVSTVIAEAKKNAQKQTTKSQATLHHQHNQVHVDSENTESGSDSETRSDESESESTITDSSPEDGSSKSSTNVEQGPPNQQSRSRKSNSNYRTSEDALNLFISAAEVLNNIVPPEVALHDHSYARAPDSIMNSFDFQGTTGLSLIAAAAAVVSPGLTRNAGSGKSGSLSPVRAPRGRPPNSQRRGGSNSTSKLSPSLLSPAGSSTNVPLNDNKTSTFRSRARSAPTDRPKSSMLHLPRPSSNLTRMSLSSTSRTSSSGNRSGIMPPASYSKQRGDSPSLKSMIALHPGSTTNGTSAFEALVNAAAAASPAELPKTSNSSSSHSLPALQLSNTTAKSSAHSTPTTPINARPQSTRTTQKDSHSSASSSASNTPTTAYFDVHQTINILVSLAQQNLIPSNSTSSGTSHSIPLLTQPPVITGLGAIVTQANPSKQESTVSQGSASSTKNVSSKVTTLLGHLTSGTTTSGSGSKSLKTSSGGASGGTSVSKNETVLNSGSKNFSLNSNSNSSNEHGTTGSPTIASTLAQTLGISSNAEELSNLDLLSNLVAVVAATQSTSASSSNNNSHSHSTTSAPMPAKPPSSSSCATQGETTTCNVTTDTSSSSSSSQTSPQTHNRTTSEQPSSTGTLPETSSSNGGSNARDSLNVGLGSPVLGTVDRGGAVQSSVVSDSMSSAIENQDGSLSNDVSQITGDSASIAQNEAKNGSIKAGSDHHGKGLKMEGSSDLLSSSNAESFSTSVDNLPRSVTRTSSAALARQEMTNSQQHLNTTMDTHNSNSSPYHQLQQQHLNSKKDASSSPHGSGSGGDMTASLASIIPAFNPQQSSLLLYTRSLSFPLSSSVEPSLADDEEDHLESATRGISELSKLLGTDAGTESTNVHSSKHDSSVYKNRTAWSPVSDLLCTNVPAASISNSVTQTFTKHTASDYNSVPMDSDNAPTKFSGLLESKIHGTVHHNPVPSPGMAHSSSDRPATSRNCNETTALDLDHSR